MNTPTAFDRWLAGIATSLDLCCQRNVGNIPGRMIRPRQDVRQ